MDGGTFWSAVGAIGTMAAAIVAYLAYRAQQRHSFQTSTTVEIEASKPRQENHQESQGVGFVLRSSSMPLTESHDIPMTSQSFVLGFDDLGSAHALALRDGIRVRADVFLTWRVINPRQWAFESHQGDPGGFSVLLPRLMSEFREFAEGLTLDEARSRRTEAIDRIGKKFAPAFRKYGMILEEIAIGAMEPLGSARPGRVD